MAEEQVVLVTNLDEVEFELDVRYAHPSKPGHWFEIEEFYGEYSLGVSLGMFSHNCITNGNMVVTWKTFEGVVRFIKRQAVDPHRRHHHLFAQFEASSEQAKYDAKVAKEEGRQARFAELRAECNQAESAALEEAVRVLGQRGFNTMVDEGPGGYSAYVLVGGATFRLEWVEPR